MVFPGLIVMPWTTTDVFNVIHRTHVEYYSPTLTAFTEVSRGLSQLILSTGYMSCFEMVEERPVTSERLNLDGRDHHLYKVRIDHHCSPDPRLNRAFRRVFRERFLIVLQLSG